MTGAPLPAAADSVVKYEIVRNVEGDGRPGSRVAFDAPVKLRNNVREAGEEARAGEAVVHAGEVINAAGVGFLASCGVSEVPVPRRPRVAIISIGSELECRPPRCPRPAKSATRTAVPCRRPLARPAPSHAAAHRGGLA